MSLRSRRAALGALPAVLAAGAFALLTGGGDPTAEPAVAAYPGPGWGFASPQTSITFRGAWPDALEGIAVTGSRTGVHRGSLKALRAGRGAVFTPREPFAAGERVHVELPVAVAGADDGTYAFTVATGPPAEWTPPPANFTRTVGRNRACELRPRRLRTVPGPPPVGICLRARDRAAAGGARILLAPRTHPRSTRRQPSLMILSGRGKLLWYRTAAGLVYDLDRQEYRDEPVLTYYVRDPDGHGHHEIVDARYRTVGRVAAGNGYRSDTHELRLTREGTAYVGAYALVRAPGGDRVLTDFVLQELDVATGDVIFEWHSLDHVPPEASLSPPPDDGGSWDYFHGNSIEPPRPGDDTIVVSARKTSAVYGIDARTGAVRWTLGGKQDDFGLAERPASWRFCAQHDVRWLANGELSVFDNGGANLNREACPVHPARVLRYRLDPDQGTAQLVRTISSRPSSDDGDGFRPAAVGSARELPSGDVIVSWGNSGRVTQVAPNGRVRFKLHLRHWTYRAARARWEGRPGGRPALAARRRGADTLVWASWNGATHVRRWQVLAGPRPGALEPVGGPFAFADLETRMRVRTSARFVAVRALGPGGAQLARSAAARVR